MRRFRILYICLFIVSLQTAWGQNFIRDNISDSQIDPSMRPIDPDSLNNEEIISLAPRMYMWNISQDLGNITPIEVDTAHHQFQNSGLMGGMNGHYNHLGNLGSPRLTRIFSDRTEPGQAFFLEPYSFFVAQPHQQTFANSNIPYSNITYFKTFDRLYGEEFLKTYFSVNVDKRLAFGFNIDYLYGRGYYSNQSTSFLKAGLFGSYISDKYKAHAIYSVYDMKMAENGGITNDLYITDPDQMDQKNIKPSDIPVNLSNTWNYNKYFYIHYNQRYNLGFYRDVTDAENPNDTIETFVPVTSLIHTVKIERARHRFISESETPGYYPVSKFSDTQSKDTTTYLGVKNVLGIALLEGFNKYAKAGLTGFISHKYNKYTLMSLDTARTSNYAEQEVFVGGELAKREGDVLHYSVLGEAGLGGKSTGQFRIKGDMDLNFRLWNDTINFSARGSITNTLPPFYMRIYHSNHYWWEHENMDKEFRTKIEGELNIPRKRTNIKVGIENVKNYTYFDQSAMPAQYTGNIQIVTARLKQNFKLGILHLDNEIAWQKSSNEDILPLPDITLYSNLYIATKLVKVLSIELGADVRYFTDYYAPAYTPAIQQFHLQSANAAERVKIGNYPIINAYINFHLKRTRFFVMMYHVNQGTPNNNYFLTPHHPINQSLLKFGLSWNFYD